MKAILVNKPGGPEQLQLQEFPIPKCEDNEVLVKIKAAGINFIDINIRKGSYAAPMYPYIPGKEASGEIVEVGNAVKDLKVGTRVAFCFGGTGSYAEYTSIDSEKIVTIPDNMDYEIAAAALLQGLTAYYLTHLTTKLTAKDTILVHAGAGGVGLLLIQIAKKIGCRVVSTVSSEAKEKLAKNAGADQVIIYSGMSFLDVVMSYTEKIGVDVVYDAVGKDTFENSIASLKIRGMLVSYGQASGPVPPFELKKLAEKSLYLTRPNLFDYAATRAELTSMAHALFDLIQHQDLQIQIGQRYSLSEAATAHRDLEERRTVGKSILLVE